MIDFHTKLIDIIHESSRKFTLNLFFDEVRWDEQIYVQWTLTLTPPARWTKICSRREQMYVPNLRPEAWTYICSDPNEYMFQKSWFSCNTSLEQIYVRIWTNICSKTPFELIFVRLFGSVLLSLCRHSSACFFLCYQLALVRWLIAYSGGIVWWTRRALHANQGKQTM